MGGAGKGRDKMFKLNFKEVRKSGWGKDSIPPLQTAVFVMAGGGYLGNFAAEQPGKFYIDDRVGKLPYTRKEIYQAVEVLKILAEENGLDPNHLPEKPSFHNMGIF
jgi:hypothetical protein